MLDVLRENREPRAWQLPEIYNLNDATDEENLNKKVKSGARVVDAIDRALLELYHIKFPDKIDHPDKNEFQAFVERLAPAGTDQYGNWVYYPWSNNLVHFPPQDDLRTLRTSRNRNLVTAQEQKKLLDDTLLVLGLSVGSNVIEALLSQGIGGTYILVDNDALDPSNLNRVRVSYADVGLHKVDIMAKKISELDPYITQIHYRDGLNEQNIEEILKHKPSVVVEEMDQLKMKILVRKMAKKYRLPVVMATDDGDDVLLDIERYDEDPDLELMHGKIPEDLIDRIISGPPLPREEAGKLIGSVFVGLENVPLRMIESLAEVGKTLPSWPQLGGAAGMAGNLLAYCCKKIILQQPLKSGRFLLGPDQSLNPELEDDEYLSNLEKARKKLAG